jgi:DNA-binding NtrC family response regulator
MSIETSAQDDRLWKMHISIPIALVVDDDPFILMDAGDILRDAGFEVREAATGDEAKAMLSQDDLGVVLLFSDVEMPGETNGFELAQYVAVHHPLIEIIIASGRASPTDGDMPARATFIAKPFSAAMVRNHLKDKLPEEKRPAGLEG